MVPGREAPFAWPAGYGRRVLAQVDSTNAEAARVADTLSGPEWICALDQTAARGRRGRAWASPAGNFAASLVLRPGDGPEALALRSFVASLALHDALSGLTNLDRGWALKWPNDVLLNGGKLAGILLEGVPPQGTLVIGIGVNLIAAAPSESVEPGALQPVSLLGETGVRVTPEALLDALASAYAQWEDRFATFGFAPIRAAWLARAARLGETITARTTRETHVGRFDTVDDSGQLVLNTSNGRITIAAADVFF